MKRLLLIGLSTMALVTAGRAELPTKPMLRVFEPMVRTLIEDISTLEGLFGRKSEDCFGQDVEDLVGTTLSYYQKVELQYSLDGLEKDLHSMEDELGCSFEELCSYYLNRP